MQLSASAQFILLGACLAATGALRTADSSTAPPAPAPSVAAVFMDAALQDDTNLATLVTPLARAAGYATRFIGVATLTNTTLLSTQQFDLLVLPNGRRLPVESIEPLQRFLKQGGDLLALGLPLWDTPVFRFQDRWISRAEHEAALAAVRAERPLFDLSREDFSKWGRSVNKKTALFREVVSTPQGPTLHVALETMDGWDTLGSPPLMQPFPEGHTLTCFQAKGGARTGPLMVEWTERDGSRWIATVELGPDWKSFALPASAFRPWEPHGGRGGVGDSLKLANVAKLTVGVAVSHGATPGPQEYWIAGLGTARNPFGNFEPPAQVNLPRLESMSPAYQCYPVTGPVVVRPSHEKAPLEFWERRTNAAELQFEMSLPLLGIHPRPGGAGFDQDRPWRWEPLLAAYSERLSDAKRAVTRTQLPQLSGMVHPTEAGNYRGALGAMVVHVKPPFFGSVWAAFTPVEPQFYQQPLVSNAVRQALTRLHRGIYLVEAGTDQSKPSFPEVHEHDVSARIANFSRSCATNLLVQIYRSFEPGFSSYKWAGDVDPGRLVACKITNDFVTAPAWEAHSPVLFHLYQAESIKDDARPIDGVVEPLTYVESAPPPPVRIQDHGFRVNSTPWKAHGVNYMPSSGIGVTSEYFERWLGRGAYDPWIIQRDLQRIQAMGLNAVSVFIYFRDLEAGHLFDFLRRCQTLNLKVNLSLRPGTPMDFRWQEMKALIEHYRLATNTTVIAYDLAWEPSHFDPAYQQKHYAGAWRDWVLKRHGSLAAAESTWGVAASAAGSSGPQTLSVPPAEQLTRDGPWRKRVADYRQFLDELLAEKYAEARRLIRTVDPNHPVSFRMQHAGDPTLNSPGLMAYDFWGLRDAVDIWEPEAYGRIGDWERVKPGHFTAAYARLCNPDLPIVWAEMGNSVWDPNRQAPSPERMEWTAQYYRDFYRMLIESGADGVFFWWYPGGYRVNENSDYGIINPDGTDRPITKVIREWGPRFLAAPKPPAPNHWISVDRDRDARGLNGIYEAVKDEYWRVLAEGKMPGLEWGKTPGARP